MEQAPHRDQTLERLLTTSNCESVKIQDFAERIAGLIGQVPLVRVQADTVRAWNEEHKGTEEVVSTCSRGRFALCSIFVSTRRA